MAISFFLSVYPLSLLSFFASLISFGLCFYVFAKNSNTKSGRVLSLVLLEFSIWSFAVAFLQNSKPDSNSVWFWYYLSSFGFAPFWPLMMHFFLLMLEADKRVKTTLYNIFLFINHSFPVLFLILFFNGNGAPNKYVANPFGLVDKPDTDSVGFWIYSICLIFWFLSSLILSIVFVVKSYKDKNSSSDQKKQSSIIFLTSLISGVLGVLFNHIFPLVGIEFPAIGSAFLIIALIGFAFAVTKYNLTADPMDVAVKEAYSNSTEPMIITTKNFLNVKMNDSFISVFKLNKMEINDFSLKKILGEELCNLIKNELQKGEKIKKMLVRNEKHFNLMIAPIYKDNNIDRILFSFSDITELVLRRQLLEKYNNELEKQVKERTEELQKEKDESEKRLSITETYTRKSLVHRIEDGFDPRTIEPEEKKVAIMFSDIRHFTSISEHLSPRKTVNLLNSYFNEINNCVIGSSNKGEIDKIIGDAVMAIFDNSKSAIDAAIDIRRCLPKLNNYIQKEYNIKIDNGIGINFGSVTYGNIGSDQKLDFTVIGDSVNLASRIEELTKYYNVPILISEATMQNINCDDYKIRFIDEIKVKGKENSTKIFEIFDYEREDIIEMKQNNQHYLDEAFKLYQIADFDNALKIYKKLEMEMPRHKYNPKFPADSVLTFYIARCQRFIKLRHDRPEMIQNWSGVYSFVVK